MPTFSAPDEFGKVPCRHNAEVGIIMVVPTSAQSRSSAHSCHLAEMQAFFQARRAEAGYEDAPFDLVVGGSTAGMGVKARDILGPLADAGATWWDERFPFDQLDNFDAVRARIEEGPPRLD